jgi:hypothetical protein
MAPNWKSRATSLPLSFGPAILRLDSYQRNKLLLRGSHLPSSILCNLNRPGSSKGRSRSSNCIQGVTWNLKGKMNCFTQRD